ncbi:MAG: hypothetical protein AMJ65_12080 [Phycisphaerae bacterium SG8_4]|nr:MAG: hypothetical protein AMJ65_12080 [Phycisphaerae bacterium SG8_4]
MRSFWSFGYLDFDIVQDFRDDAGQRASGNGTGVVGFPGQARATVIRKRLRSCRALDFAY